MIANDKNRYLIEMWKYLQNDGFVFNHISKTLYNFARDCYHGKNNFFTEAGVGLIGFMASFNGRFFDGGYSGHNVVGKNGKARDYIREQIENTMRDIPLLQGVEFYSGSYDELVIPDRSIVYCDLPYKATKKYDVSKNFDYERFYIWCMEMARRGHKVFISEYQMPQEFRCVWEKEVTNSLNPNITKRPIERLFTID